MKTKLYFLTGIIAAILVTACTPVHRSKDVNAETCLNALKAYYPYSVDEEFVFVNDELGLTWEAKAYDYGKGVYPEASKDEYFSITDGNSYGSWYAMIHAWITTNGMPPKQHSPGTNYSSIYYTGTYHIAWYFQLYFNPENWFDGGYSLECSESDVLPSLTDTIILPIPLQINGTDMVEPSKGTNGAYARIVKHQGLTDFSTDGKTVWKRVKE